MEISIFTLSQSMLALNFGHGKVSQVSIPYKLNKISMHRRKLREGITEGGLMYKIVYLKVKCLNIHRSLYNHTRKIKLIVYN